MTSAYRPEAIPTPLSEDQWYTLIHTRISEYLASNLQDKVGDEFIRAAARSAALVDQRDYLRAHRTLLANAEYQTRAQGQMTFEWAEQTKSAYTIKAGTPIAVTKFGLIYRLAEDMARARNEAAGTKTLDVECLWYGIEGDQFAFDSARMLADQFYTMYPDPDGPTDYISSTGNLQLFLDDIKSGDLTITEATEFAGGSDGEAYGIGLDVGMTPEEDEGIGFFRTRIAAMAKQVTYTEIAEGVNLILSGYDTRVKVIHSMVQGEQWGGADGFAWGVDSWSSYFVFLVYIGVPGTFTADQTARLVNNIQNYVDAVSAAGYEGVVLPYVAPAQLWAKSAPVDASTQYFGKATDIDYRDEAWVAVWAKSDPLFKGTIFSLKAGADFISIAQDGTQATIVTVDHLGLTFTSDPAFAPADTWCLYVLRKLPANSGVELHVKPALPLAPFSKVSLNYAPTLTGTVGLYVAALDNLGTDWFKYLRVGQVAMGNKLTTADFQKLTTLDNEPRSLVDLSDVTDEWVVDQGSDVGADIVVPNLSTGASMTFFNRNTADLVTDSP